MKIREMYENGITISDIAKKAGRGQIFESPSSTEIQAITVVSILAAYKTYIGVVLYILHIPIPRNSIFTFSNKGYANINAEI